MGDIHAVYVIEGRGPLGEQGITKSPRGVGLGILKETSV